TDEQAAPGTPSRRCHRRSGDLRRTRGRFRETDGLDRRKWGGLQFAITSPRRGDDEGNVAKAFRVRVVRAAKAPICETHAYVPHLPCVSVERLSVRLLDRLGPIDLLDLFPEPEVRTSRARASQHLNLARRTNHGSIPKTTLYTTA